LGGFDAIIDCGAAFLLEDRERVDARRILSETLFALVRGGESSETLLLG
jgi:hypothetical protein